MGLTSFAGKQVTLADTRVAKNYLEEDELKRLNNLVSAFFDLAEFRAQSHLPTYMADYVEQLDNTIRTVGADVLEGAGTVSHEQAMTKAEREYRRYQVQEVSPVERSYLDSLNEAEKVLSKRRE